MKDALTYTVRTISEDDWTTLRTVRLQALAESPTSFETLHADAAAWPVARWRDRARGSAVSRDVIAFRGAEPVGMAGAYIGDDGAGEVISVWVHPAHRGCGVGRLVVAGAMEWARSAGGARFRLWVTDGNDAARNLYETLGFVATGARQPVSTQPGIEEIEMRLAEPDPVRPTPQPPR